MLQCRVFGNLYCVCLEKRNAQIVIFEISVTTFTVVLIADTESLYYNNSTIKQS